MSRVYRLYLDYIVLFTTVFEIGVFFPHDTFRNKNFIRASHLQFDEPQLSIAINLNGGYYASLAKFRVLNAIYWNLQYLIISPQLEFKRRNHIHYTVYNNHVAPFERFSNNRNYHDSNTMKLLRRKVELARLHHYL